jgi:predicted acylesterase/phospholipase RssA
MNVPADVMKSFSNGGRVIAVDASPKVDPSMTADYGFGISGWQVLLDRLNPFSRRKGSVPSLVSILRRTMEFGDASRNNLEAGDLWLSLPLGRFNVNDFHQGREIANAAYEYSLPLLRAWKAKNQRTSHLPLPTVPGLDAR